MTLEVSDVLYDHLPGEEENPLMENTLHAKWGHLLIGAARHTLAGTGVLVTGNVRLDPVDRRARTAPDVMVIPDWDGTEFGAYEPGPDAPVPTVCVEILSPSNRGPRFQDRLRRLLELGVAEVFVLDPLRHKVTRQQLGTDGAIVESDAIGTPSVGLAMTFVRHDNGLALCCPAGRLVSPASDPYNWLEQEQTRADREQARADEERARADEERARADALAAEVAELRARLGG